MPYAAREKHTEQEDKCSHAACDQAVAALSALPFHHVIRAKRLHDHVIDPRKFDALVLRPRERGQIQAISYVFAFLEDENSIRDDPR